MDQQYEITVAGEVVTGAKHNIRRENFEEVFVLGLSGGEALSAIQNRLLEPRLKKNFPEYRHWRTCGIINQKPISESKLKEKLSAKDLPTMSLDEMAQFTVEQKLKTDPHAFGNIEGARIAIQNELKKPKAKNNKATKKVTQKASKSEPADDLSGDEFPDDV